MKLSKSEIAKFQSFILEKGKELYRPMPWREDCNPYYILLSEIMLQQTQVPRVLVKFDEFITKFPTLESLALADFFEVLSCWSGLGYNRRAKYLHESTKEIYKNGGIPSNLDFMKKLPGIGPNTAASILVYSFNIPHVFVETNIRTVYIYHFLQDYKGKVPEIEIQNLVEQTMYSENPRQWYWALMDYGTYVKKTQGNYNKLSKLHTTQSKFEGSNRQKRAQILKLLIEYGGLQKQDILEKLDYPQDLVYPILESLIKESMIQVSEGRYYIR